MTHSTANFTSPLFFGKQVTSHFYAKNDNESGLVFGMYFCISQCHRAFTKMMPVLGACVFSACFVAEAIGQHRESRFPLFSPKVDPLALLTKISHAAKTLPYTGIVVHQTPEQSVTTRITHLVDRAGVEQEKIEFLDGPVQEIIRRNDEIMLYRPDSKTVLVDRRMTGRFFPSLISGNAQAIIENYNLKVTGNERIGGLECQWITLEPKDGMRYMHRLCSELQSGLLLRAAMYNNQNQMVESFSFTQLEMGRGVANQNLRSRFEAIPGWQKDYVVPKDVTTQETGWQAASVPPGFKKVLEFSRTLAGRNAPVSQIIFSDGLAHVSVFVESANGVEKVMTQSNGAGATNYALRPVAEFQITVVGEVPVAAVQAIADGVKRHTGLTTQFVTPQAPSQTQGRR
jgi:sigma-E factor negative regulatory protein RseB